MQTTLDFDRVFQALADGTRRDIVRRAIAGEEGVAELAGHYPMSFAAVQKHVAILERAGLTHEIVTYQGAGHAFFNDTGPRYNQAAATRAYAKVLDWFGQHLA